MTTELEPWSLKPYLRFWHVSVTCRTFHIFLLQPGLITIDHHPYGIPYPPESPDHDHSLPFYIAVSDLRSRFRIWYMVRYTRIYPSLIIPSVKFTPAVCLLNVL